MMDLTDEDLHECPDCGLTVLKVVTSAGAVILMEPDPSPQGQGNWRVRRGEGGSLVADPVPMTDADPDAHLPHLFVCTPIQAAGA